MTNRRQSRGAPENSADADAEASDGTTFEEALQRLEAIVDRLEEGDLELAEALATFEDGVKLTRRCAGQLEDAERRIEILVREGEKWVSRPFEESEESE
jgi:exodeoxyribonuclease VII small subunit